MEKYYLGIDLGLKGGLSLIRDDKKLICVDLIPTISVKVGKKLRNKYDLRSIIDLISAWNTEYNIVKAGMERLRGMPGQSSITGFSMGYGSGVFKTILVMLGIPYVEFEPVVWQRAIFKPLGVQYDKKTTKQASIQAAQQLAPSENFLRTERSKVPCDGLTDSFLIGLYTLKLDL